jgi:hypothetical protein
MENVYAIVDILWILVMVIVKNVIIAVKNAPVQRIIIALNVFQILT